MNKNEKGDLIFNVGDCKEHEKVFIFTKDNFLKHSAKHDISSPRGLKYVEEALNTPDCITKGKSKDQWNYYKVLKSQKSTVYVYKIVVFQKGKKRFTIATAYNFWSAYYQVIHYLEEVVWKKDNSRI
jgi:hypothetical protein